jgi:hypothetical protein
MMSTLRTISADAAHPATARHTAPPVVRPSPFTPVLRRTCACGGAVGPTGECESCRRKRLQRQAASAGPAVAPPVVHDVLRSTGAPLDAGTRSEMEPRFGHSFADVRVHADARAGESARAVGAHAYAVGRDVVFGAGRYAPGSAEGRRLIAHELAHVVQQRASASASLQPRLEIGAVDDPAEREAEGAAAAVLSGGRPAVGAWGGLRLSRDEDTASPPAGGPVSAPVSAPGGAAAGGEAGQAGEARSSSGGLCIRTPFGPGQVRFLGCTGTELSRYGVLPESGSTRTTPVNSTWYDADGIWDSKRANPREWFKVSDHCDATFTCQGGGLSRDWCCNAAASLFMGTPHWTTDGHAAVP